MANPFNATGNNPYTALPANPYKAPAAPVVAPMGTKAISPTTTVTKPPTTLPKAQTAPAPASAGSYNGVNITPGTDAAVAAQVAKINANKAATQTPQTSQPPAATPSYPGLMGAQIQAKDQAAAAPATPPSYQGLVGSLTGASNPTQNQQTYTANLANAATPNATQTGLLGSLKSAAAGNTAIGQEGQHIADQYGNEISRVGNFGAQLAGGQLSTGTLPVGEGNAAITSQTTSARMQALSDAENAQLAGIDKQLAAQGQLQSGYTSALGGANTQQAQQLSGLGAAAGSANTQQQQQIGGLNYAAGYAQPQLGSIGQVPFNPLTQGQGDVLGSQGGGLQNAGNLLGQFQGAQAAGAAPGQAQAGVVNTQTQQQAGYQSALQQGQNLQSQLSDLITTFGLNPSDINGVNAGIQKIAQNTSSPQYKILQNYVNDIANTYAQVLTPPGGSATDTSRGIASSMLDATAKGQSLLTVMQSLDSAAKAKIAGVSTTGSHPSTGGSTGGNIVQTKAGAVNTSW